MPNVDNQNNCSEIRMNKTTSIAVLAATLVGTMALTTGSAFAYEKSQATS